MKPFFKIIIPNYNNMPYIKKCLDSVLSQTFTDWFCVVVDDMSTDFSDQIAQSYAKKYPDKFKFIKLSEKKYAGGARNAGLDEATESEYIWFIDSDDNVYDNTVLQRMHDTIKKTNPDILNLSFISANDCQIKTPKDKRFIFIGQAPWRRCIKYKFKACRFLADRAICNDVIWFGRLIDAIDFNKVESLDYPCVKYNKSISSGWFGNKNEDEQQIITKSFDLLEYDLKNEVFKTAIGNEYKNFMVKTLPKIKANRISSFKTMQASAQKMSAILPELPVVTVILTTHNRTNIACQTIKHLVQNLKYPKLKWCISDDRSREGHIEKLVQQFVSCGIKNLKILKTTSTRYGLGASINNGLKYAWTNSDIALTCEDDWILTKPLDITNFVKEMLNGKIALIKLATKNNIQYNLMKYNSQLSQINIKDNIIKNNIESWLYNNQVALRHKSVFDKIGYYKENCSSYEQEVDFNSKFKKLSDYGRNEKHKVMVLNAIKANTIIDDSLYFIHIGKFSSRECNRNYNIPKQFEQFCLLDRKDEIIEIEKRAREYAINVQHLNLRNPKTYQDKIGILKTTYNELKSRCSDKILVKEYVKSKLGKDICPKTINIQCDPKYFKLDMFPNKFVLKCNHGCGYNIIVKDKSKFNLDNAIQQLKIWLKQNYFDSGKEIQYHFIDRKAFAEEFIGEDNKDTVDYKFLCFNGKPTYCGIISDRNNAKKHLNYYDMNFKFVDMCRLDFPNNPKLLDTKPAQFEEMKIYAKKLSEDFDFVRVDFYIHNNTVYLGELTFTPGNAKMQFKNPQHAIMLGNMLNLK